jgi:hypothetical protein
VNHLGSSIMVCSVSPCSMLDDDFLILKAFVQGVQCAIATEVSSGAQPNTAPTPAPEHQPEAEVAELEHATPASSSQGKV